MLIVTGLALYAAGIASALVIPGVFIIFCAFIAWPPVFSGVYRLVKGELIDPRTGRVAGSWSTRNAIAIMLGVLVGLAMIYPTLELGRVVYQSHHGIVEEDEDVEVPTWDPVEAGHDPKPEEEPPPKKQRRRRTPRRERR